MEVKINFNITEAAIKEIKKAMKDAQVEDHNVRVSVSGGGCSGFMYGLGFEEKEQKVEDDVLENYNDINVVIDKKSLLFLDGVTLDWVEDLNQRGFKFNNPNATKTCGCGKSFQ